LHDFHATTQPTGGTAGKSRDEVFSAIASIRSIHRKILAGA
jgi:hypothetical protein